MTFLGKVKNTLSSLPLPLLDDLDNLCVLTPNRFLLAKQPLYFNPTSIKGEHINSRRRWKAGQASSKRYRSVTKNVLEAFIKEYLPILLTRKKWNKRQWNMPKKDIIIIMDDNIMTVGKIIETFPGKTGIAWSVKLRCNRICTLEENGWCSFESWRSHWWKIAPLKVVLKRLYYRLYACVSQYSFNVSIALKLICPNYVIVSI